MPPATRRHGSLIVANLQGRITFVSEPVTGNQHDMAKLKGSDAEKIGLYFFKETFA